VSKIHQQISVTRLLTTPITSFYTSSVNCQGSNQVCHACFGSCLGPVRPHGSNTTLWLPASSLKNFRHSPIKGHPSKLCSYLGNFEMNGRHPYRKSIVPYIGVCRACRYSSISSSYFQSWRLCEESKGTAGGKKRGSCRIFHLWQYLRHG
jgi:hypothetical protein